VISADESGALDCCWIYPAVVLTAVLAGTGLVELAGWRKSSASKGINGLLAGSLRAAHDVGFPATLSLTVWTGPTFAAPRDRAHGGLLAPSLVARGPARRGIALHGLTGRGLGAVRRIYLPLPTASSNTMPIAPDATVWSPSTKILPA
jgi:hypothetical protein